MLVTCMISQANIPHVLRLLTPLDAIPASQWRWRCDNNSIELLPHLRGKAGMGGKLNLIKSRELRKNPTDAECKLWRHLRSRQVGGYKFRRQYVLGSYIVDF